MTTGTTTSEVGSVAIRFLLVNLVVLVAFSFKVY